MHPYSLYKPPCSTTSYVYTLYIPCTCTIIIITLVAMYVVLISSRHYHERFMYYADIAKNVQWEPPFTHMY